MASGDVVLETTGVGSELWEYYKSAGGGGPEYKVTLKSDDPDDFHIQLNLEGNRVGATYPPFLGSGKKYKIKITEV